MEDVVNLASPRHLLDGAVPCLWSLLGVKSGGIGIVRMAVTELGRAQLALADAFSWGGVPHPEDDHVLLQDCIWQLAAALQLCQASESAVCSKHLCYTSLTYACYALFWAYRADGLLPQGVSEDLRDVALSWGQHYQRCHYAVGHPPHCNDGKDPWTFARSRK